MGCLLDKLNDFVLGQGAHAVLFVLFESDIDPEVKMPYISPDPEITMLFLGPDPKI